MCLTPTSLSKEHEDLLVRMVVEIAGEQTSKENFTEVLLDFLEDISGFEVMSRSRTRQVINHFWRKYRGEETC